MLIHSPPDYMTVDQTAEYLHIGRTAVYKRIRTGAIPALKIGRRYVISRSRLSDLLDKATPGSFD
jgi:excisionase family DNA binding protein